jgi:hypothetical protein
LINVLFPLLDRYSLYTTKYLDYIDFKSAVNLLFSLSTTRLSGEEFIFIKSIISNMNSTRTTYNYDIIPSLVVDPFWLLGLIEGEGTFGLRNLTPYFQLAQHNRSLMILNTISSYLSNLPKSFVLQLTVHLQ